MNRAFHNMINEDIQTCKYYNSYCTADLEKLIIVLVKKYEKLIPELEGSIYNMDEGDEDYIDILKLNIEIIKEKLVIYKMQNFDNENIQNKNEEKKDNSTEEDVVKEVPVNVYLSANANSSGNTVNNNIEISTTFNDARDSIENMQGLNDDEIEEILQKISELEEIVNKNERKSTKWKEAKNIVKWMADKSVDVAKTLLPLILKIE